MNGEHRAVAGLRPAGLRVRQTAQHLSVGESTVWKLLKDGELRSIKLSTRTTLVMMDSIDDFIRRRAAQAVAA